MTSYQKVQSFLLQFCIPITAKKWSNKLPGRLTNCRNSGKDVCEGSVYFISITLLWNKSQL